MRAGGWLASAAGIAIISSSGAPQETNIAIPAAAPPPAAAAQRNRGRGSPTA